MWAGSINCRPFWQRGDCETCVWYFNSPNVLTMTFDGWCGNAQRRNRVSLTFLLRATKVREQATANKLEQRER